MPKVSVIIPFYNQNKEFLDKALNSVLNQSLEDIEIICIDDGSVDNTCFEYISEKQKNDNRIKLYKKEHAGAGIARNFGIEKSTGENIMFLDSDDFYPDNYVLQKLYDLKKEHNVLIAGGKHLILNNGKYEEPYFNYGDINEFFCNKKVNYFDYQFPWWYWCFMFDSSLIKDNEINFPPYIRYQDPPFFVRLMNKAKVFYAADFISYIHRDSKKLFNMTNEMAQDHIKGICNVMKYAKENQLNKLYSLLKELFFSFDIVNILEKSLTPEEINKTKELINNI